MGTWEWLAAGLVKAGFSVTALAKTQPDSQYTKLLDEYRAQVGVEIFARGAASELLAASRALKKGRILGFLADQDAGPGGAFIEFLGEVCSTQWALLYLLVNLCHQLCQRLLFVKVMVHIK